GYFTRDVGAPLVEHSMMTDVQPNIEPGGNVSPRVRRVGPAALVAALVLYLAVYLRWPSEALQIDLSVYRFGATRILHGLDLYSIGYTGNPTELLFIYPPFAALFFIPLAFIGEHSMDILSLLAMGSLLTYTVQRSLKSLGLNASQGLWSLSALLVAVTAWLEPVRLTVQLGQINLVILAVVVADLLGPAGRKWAGVGIGLMAGIKLTPAIFIVLLVLLGRVRPAAVAAATLIATIALGFAVAPTDSKFYWIKRHFADVSRISHDPFANTSVHGLFLRLQFLAALGTAVALGLAIAGLALGAIAYRRGHTVLALAVVGMASTAVSPFSWSHHWVWFIPLIVHLGYRACVLRSALSGWAMWLLCVLCGGWFVAFPGDTPQAGLLSLRPGGMWDKIIPGAYVFVFLAVCVVTAVWLWRSERALSSRTHTATRTEPETADAKAL
ncbi:MAG: alpha,2-mannosyltransferase, partial [Mycobacterium sp.]|nr:alpha,2-mannosyltransferase [Mycobacterium sp.]